MGRQFSIKIDAKRPYGEIHPNLDGALFEQDGLFFDAAGLLLEDKLTPDQRKALEEREARAKAERAAEAARRKALAEAGLLDEGEVQSEAGAKKARKAAAAAAETAKNGEGPDLAQWARGAVQLPFDKVQNAVRELYGRQVTNVTDAIDVVAEALSIPAEELRAA